jgi:hypothetical protein
MSEDGVKYEFSNEENKGFELLVRNLRNFVAPLLTFALLEIVAAGMIYSANRPEWGPAFYPFSALLGLVCVSFCTLIWQASTKFQLIVDTEGADIDHLMDALTKVKKSLMLASALLFSLSAMFIGAIIQVAFTAERF